MNKLTTEQLAEALKRELADDCFSDIDLRQWLHPLPMEETANSDHALVQSALERVVARLNRLLTPRRVVS